MNDGKGLDLDRFLRASRRVDLSGIRWSEVREHRLVEAEARTLTYMMDIESHTIVFLRDLLATRAALDPEITAFLSCWAYEEFWHGEAFSRFLGEAEYPLPPDKRHVGATSEYPSRTQRIAWIREGIGMRHVAYIGKVLASAMISDFPAVHMTWGAVNELSTLTAYSLLRERTRHPVLKEMLHAIMKDERRHFGFYRAQARMRLSDSGRARVVTRWMLAHKWAPVGTGVRPQEETDHVIRYLFGHEAGLRTAQEMDRTIGELPGLEGLRIFERAVVNTLKRAHDS
jgi:rubrerythrin